MTTRIDALRCYLVLAHNSTAPIVESHAYIATAHHGVRHTSYSIWVELEKNLTEPLALGRRIPTVAGVPFFQQDIEDLVVS